MDIILLIIIGMFVEIGLFFVALKGADLYITRKNKKQIWKSKYERK